MARFSIRIADSAPLTAPTCLLKAHQNQAISLVVIEKLVSCILRLFRVSASPKPHPSKRLKPCGAEVALQHSRFCSTDVIFTKAAPQQMKNCTATLKKLCAFLSLHFPYLCSVAFPRTLVSRKATDSALPCINFNC